MAFWNKISAIIFALVLLVSCFSMPVAAAMTSELQIGESGGITAADDEQAIPDEIVVLDEPAIPDEPVVLDEPAIPDDPVVLDEPAIPDEPAVLDEPDKPSVPGMSAISGGSHPYVDSSTSDAIANKTENIMMERSGITTFSTIHTQQEAISWLYSILGQSLDKDNAYGAQCVDLILAYYDYLGVPRSYGNGKDYATNPLPSGWQRIAGAVPQPGDILVYGESSDNKFGHVAIYENDFSHFHQNFNGHSYVERVTQYRYDWLTNPYWGVIRPDFTATPTPVTMSWGNDSCESSDTNAVINTRATPSVRGTFTEAGISIWNGGALVGAKTETISTTASYLNVWYDVSGEVGLTLIPGTMYTYQFFVTFNGIKYTGPILELTTTGETPITEISLSETAATMNVGDTLELKASVSPSYANNKTVSWETSNASVAMVSEGRVKAVGVGTAKIIATTFNGKKATCAITVSETTTATTIPMYRLYNPYTLEHLFTSSTSERDSLVFSGWHDEGIGWHAPSTGAKIYRLYNPYDDFHFYTMSELEIGRLTQLGWTVDGTICSSETAEDGVPIYRLFNPYEKKNYHHYTGNTEEYDYLATLGWIQEGAAWYGVR